MATDDELERSVHVGFNRLRGRLAGFIEGCGLPQRQERAIIATLKSLTYDHERDLIELLKD